MGCLTLLLQTLALPCMDSGPHMCCPLAGFMEKRMPSKPPADSMHCISRCCCGCAGAGGSRCPHAKPVCAEGEAFSLQGS